MPKLHFAFFIIAFILLDATTAKVVECRIATGLTTECSPYSKRFIKAKKTPYDLNSKGLIVTKTLPVPKKRTSMKVISVEDMIEKYVKVEESVRFKGLNEILAEEVKIDAQIKEIKLRNQDILDKKVKLAEEKVKEVAKKQRAGEKSIKEKLTELEKVRLKRKELFDKMNAQKEKKRKEKLEVQRVSEENKALKIIEDKKKKELQEKHKNQGLYSVEKGDGLSTIAAKFSMKTSALIALNKLTKKASIKIGQKLVIPYSQERIDVITKAEYIITSGDNFGSIAQDFNLTSAAIIKMNNMKKNSTIRIGQKILLPFSHKLAENKAKKQKLLAQKEALKKKKAKAKAKKRKLLSKKRKMKKVRGFGKRKLRVTATAYTSHRGQTDKTPFLAAWNNRLRPGMKIIAVSRDMLKRHGLRNGSKVKIGGLSGYYTVRDKMNKRFRKRIDIYMGLNKRRALRWGRRSVMLYW